MYGLAALTDSTHRQFASAENVSREQHPRSERQILGVDAGRRLCHRRESRLSPRLRINTRGLQRGALIDPLRDTTRPQHIAYRYVIRDVP